MKHNNKLKITFPYNYFLIILSLFTFNGCMGTTMWMDMMPNNFDIISRHNSTISLHVEGWDDKSLYYGRPGIPSVELKKAIENSIINSNVFSKVIADGGSDYLLKVKLTRMDYPYYAYDVEVQMTALWQLSDRSTKEVVWENIITTKYTTKYSETYNGALRLKLANEGAARANIQTGIHEISLLQLK